MTEYPIPKALLDNVDEDDPRIRPDEGNTYLFKAEATLDVNFSKEPSNPKISIESNKISYGNKAVESVLDKRSFLQVLIDKIKTFIGKNAAVDLSGSKDKKSDESPENTEDSPRPKF